MNVIIVKKDPFRDNHHPLLSYPWLLVSLLGLLFILIGVAYVAYHYGGQQAKLAINAAVLKFTPAAQASVSPMATAANSIVLGDKDKELEELASRLGDLQAKMIQLNEIGNQLIQLSKLEEDEFDFTFDWSTGLTEEQIIALEDLPEEEPATTVATKEEDKKSSAKDKPAKDKKEEKLAKKENKEDQKANKKSDKSESKSLLALAAKPVNKPEKAVVEKKEIKNQAVAKLTIDEVKKATEKLGKQVEKQTEEVAVIEDIMLSRRGQAKILPTGWPIKQGYLSSGFGMRGRRVHKGVDLVTKSGSNIYAVEDGEVTFSGQMRGYGNLIEIKHGDTYSTRYGHNTKNLVRVGDKIKKGQVIGLVGSTGRATTAHVHFELLKRGSAVNPMQFLASIQSFKLAQK